MLNLLELCCVCFSFLFIVCVAAVVPVFCEIFFSRLLFVFFHHFVSVAVQYSKLLVIRVLFTDIVSDINE